VNIKSQHKNMSLSVASQYNKRIMFELGKRVLEDINKMLV